MTVWTKLSHRFRPQRRLVLASRTGSSRDRSLAPTPASPGADGDADARGRRRLAARWAAHNVPLESTAGATVVFRIEAENAGRDPWLRDPVDGHGISVVLFVEGREAGGGAMLRERVEPGERTVFTVSTRLPRARGAHRLRFDLAARNLARFSDLGTPPLELTVRLREPVSSPDDRLLAHSSRHNPFFFSPSQGVQRGRDGYLYPLFAERAAACTITDVAGREFVDVHMGWGCCLLGYSEPSVQAAVARQAAECGGLLSLPHRLEIEVSEALCAGFPFGDQVIFGKNGSDVTTWAVRTARVATGRRTVLFAGYHGWQDWYVATQGFDATGVPSGNNPYNILLPYRDLAALERALALHEGDVAAVITDPANTDIDLDDPNHERDGPYLRSAAELARRAGALFILDEIMTGFRFRGGSAQAAYGLRPDMTCLGKALANGMPLSALVARGDLLARHSGRIFYAPTMKGEVYSFAAALAALRIYREQDVPTAVWRTGEEIRREVDRRCRDLDLDAALIGAPYRMFLRFGGMAEEADVLARTLLQQELTRHAVISYRGFVILSRAHDGRAVDRCVSAFEAALRRVDEALHRRTVIQVLDTPNVVLDHRTASPLDADQADGTS